MQRSGFLKILSSLLFAGMLCPAAYAQNFTGIAADSGPHAPGSKIRYEIMVANRAAANVASGTDLSIVIPAHLSVLRADVLSSTGSLYCGNTTAWQVCNSGQVLGWFGQAGFLAGEARAFQFSALVAAGASGSEALAATVTPVSPSALPFGVSSTVQYSAAAPALPRLTLRASTSGTPATGSTYDYVVSYGNASSTAVNAALELSLPSGLNLVSASDGGVLNGGTVQWNLGTLSAAEYGERRVTVQSAAGLAAGTILAAQGRLYDTGNGATLSQAGVLTPVVNRQLRMAMTATPDPVAPGERVRYEIAVTNDSAASVASGADVTVLVPPYMSVQRADVLDSTGSLYCGTTTAWTVCSSGQVLSWYGQAGFLAGEVRLFQFTAQLQENAAPPDGTLIPAVALGDHATILSGGSAKADVAVRGTARSAPQLQLASEAGGVAAGGTYSYVLSYGNGGNAALNAGLALSLPAGVTLVSAGGGTLVSGDTLQWNLGTLSGAEHGERRVTVRTAVDLPEGTLLVGQSRLYDMSSGDTLSRASVLTPAATRQLRVAITATPDPVASGERVRYEIAVTNDSTASVASGADVTILVPPYLSVQRTDVLDSTGSLYCGLTTAWTVCSSGQALSWYGQAGFRAGEVRLFQFTAQVQAPPGGALIPAVAVADHSTILSGGTAKVDVAVKNTARAAPQLQLSSRAAGVGIGGSYDYVLAYGNGSATALAAALELSLPAGVSFVSASEGGVLDGNTVHWNLGTLSGAGHGERRVKVRTTAGLAEGTMLLGKGRLYDTLSGDTLSRAGVLTTVADRQLRVALTATPDPVAPGERVRYEIAVTNDSTASVASGADVTMLVPPYMSVQRTDVLDSTGSLYCGLTTAWTVCNSGQALSWYGQAGFLPGEVRLFQFTALLQEGAAPPSGALIPAVAAGDHATILSGGSAKVDVVVKSGARSAPQLQLASEPGGTIADGVYRYVLSYGFPGNAVNAGMELSLPDGVSLVSANGGAVLTGNTVQWNLGSVAGGTSGERRVTVQVAAGTAEGTLLVGQARLYEAASGDTLSRAGVLTPVSTRGLRVTMMVVPDTASPGERLRYRISLSNDSPAAVASGADLVIPVPPYTSVQRTDVLASSGSIFCGNTTAWTVCSSGKLLSWYGQAGFQADETRLFEFTAQVLALPAGALIPAVAVGDHSTILSGGTSKVDVGIRNTLVPTPQACFVDADADVDSKDINLIVAARNASASGPFDPRDPDRNGVINALDARQCTALCTRTGCVAD